MNGGIIKGIGGIMPGINGLLVVSVALDEVVEDVALLVDGPADTDAAPGITTEHND